MHQRLLSLLIVAAWASVALGQEDGPSHAPATAEEAEHVEYESAPPRWWFRGEYLLWFIKNQSAPPLVTTGFAIESRPGALGVSSTKLLYGGENSPSLLRNGGRFTGGWWTDDEHCFGLEAGYFFLGARAARYANSSTGEPVLARPFFDALNNAQDSSLFAYPSLVSGDISVSATTFMDGAEINGVLCLCHDEHWRLAGLAGFRYLRLDEDLRIDERDDVSLTSPRFAGSAIGVTDVFDTQNHFYGGQLGFKAEFEHHHFYLDVVAKVALGGSHEVVRSWGQTTINGVTVADAGLLVLASNRGVFTRDAFAVVPEVGVNLGYQITHGIRAFVGYSFLYWSDVLRPGDQVDIALNPNLIPTSATFGFAGGPPRPAAPVHSADFWAQGISFGMEIRY